MRQWGKRSSGKRQICGKSSGEGDRHLVDERNGSAVKRKAARHIYILIPIYTLNYTYIILSRASYFTWAHFSYVTQSSCLARRLTCLSIELGWNKFECRMNSPKEFSSIFFGWQFSCFYLFHFFADVVVGSPLLSLPCFYRRKTH